MSLIPVADLQTKHWLSCQSILNRFEADWQRGVPPDLSTFVPQEEQIRLPVLFELILTDIEFRLRSGEEPRIESYLLQFPELNESDAFLVDLIVGECELRRSRESNFSQDEYLLRFPSHAAQVREKLATVSQRGSIVSTSRFSKLVYDNEKELQTSSLSIPGFEIISILGRGGMGVVFEARQIDLHRTVAIKVMRASMDDPSMSRRFFAEAEAVARLRHDNIVQVYSGGVHNNRAYLVMELARGQTLEESWNKNPPSSRQVAETIRGLSSAIAYAHQQGIVHRDLKPSNILYDESGVARITDFGLAKALMSDESATVTGEILGTPAYMSPEQAVGESKNLGPSTDIYSLGAMLYQGLTGIPPFSGTSPMDTLAQIRWSQPMRPKELQPSSPFDLETICLKCLEKEPASRYADATELALDLQRFLEGKPILARRTSLHEKAIKWCRRRPAIAAMSLLLMTTCLFGAILVGQQWRKATISLAKANERQRARLAGLVDSFLSASPESALNTLAEVRKVYASIPALLAERERTTTGLEVSDNLYASQSQSEYASVAHRIDLVMLKSEPTRLLRMARIMVSTPPQEFLFLRAALDQLQNEILTFSNSIDRSCKASLPILLSHRQIDFTRLWLCRTQVIPTALRSTRL
jgi:serine/threonine protein kinase